MPCTKDQIEAALKKYDGKEPRLPSANSYEPRLHVPPRACFCSCLPDSDTKTLDEDRRVGPWGRGALELWSVVCR